MYAIKKKLHFFFVKRKDGGVEMVRKVGILQRHFRKVEFRKVKFRKVGFRKVTKFRKLEFHKVGVRKSGLRT